MDKHAKRKAQPILTGLIDYFPNACLYVSEVSLKANDQHNAGQPMHWAKEKSIGDGNEILRHLIDRGKLDDDGLLHTGKVAWRAMELLERELSDNLTEKSF
tara:strand:- start:971 stop:1273 length:303 start_codon:yes stop_codon:yes gene_type:complete